MTHIYCCIGENSITFDAQGHTGYAEQGKDIVCAAVSALTSEWMFAVDEFLKKGMCEQILRVLKSGKVVSCISFDKDDTASVSTIYFLTDIILQCLAAISEQYPANVYIEVDDERNNEDSKQDKVELDEDEEEDRHFLPWKH